MTTKTNTAKLFTVMLFVVAASVVTIVTSCKKSSDTASSDVVTEQAAVDAVTEAVVPTSSGFVDQGATATVIVNGGATCGKSFDSSITRSSAAGAAITYTASLKWGWTLSCSTPATFSFNFAGKMVYDAPRISSADSSVGSFTVTGLTSSAYTFNANYVRKGSQVSKVGYGRSFSSTITITATNLVIDKATQLVLSGNATVTVTGASSTGKTFSYNGTITFTGNKTATITIANGSTYTISW